MNKRQKKKAAKLMEYYTYGGGYRYWRLESRYAHEINVYMGIKREKRYRTWKKQWMKEPHAFIFNR